MKDTVIKEDGTVVKGCDIPFELICKKCGREARLIPTHKFDGDFIHPKAINLIFTCICGNEFEECIDRDHFMQDIKINKGEDIMEKKIYEITLEDLMNNAKEKINDALYCIERANIKGNNKIREILDAENCMGQFRVYLEMIETVDTDKYFDISEQTEKMRAKILKAIEDLV